MTRYHDLWDNMLIPGRWHVDNPVDELGSELNPWQFKDCKRLTLAGAPLLPLARDGTALEFTLTAFTIPLVHRRFISIFNRLALQDEAQLIPVRVEGQQETYFILNALQALRCIDDSRCEEVLCWRPEDKRPDRVGEYRNVAGLRIDPSKVGGARVFRLWGWMGALIVSEHVKQALEDEGFTGPEFIEV